MCLMMDNSKYTKATWLIMERLLESETLDDSLAGALEIIVAELDSEAGAIWLLDQKSGRLAPVFHIGPADISNLSIENGIGTEGSVAKNGKPVMISNTASDSGYEGTVFDDAGLKTKSLICVPLKNVKESIGCFIIVNKNDGRHYNEEELLLCEHMAALAGMTIAEKGFFIEFEENKEVLASLKNVTKQFRTGDNVNLVLKGINLDIYKNEFVVVLGESGCGKTTMMNIIGCMDSLTSGTLTIEGKDYSHPTDKDLTDFRRDYVGFIFQQYNLMPNLTALENVRFIAELCKNPMPAEEALAKVNLSDRAGNYPGQLSGGQQQRVSIARALAKDPKIILGDEPTGALDSETGKLVIDMLQKLSTEHGNTVILVTHNADIAKCANRIIHMRNGKIKSIKTNDNPLSVNDIEW